ncbi:MAG: type II secretion system F family protein [candidate division WOR-3 bacterium]|nr:MAG: type II secretion system F family protein [candidate division WOR-3 bacterium]
MFFIGALLILAAVGLIAGPVLLRRPKPAAAAQGLPRWSRPTESRLGTGLLEKLMPQVRQFADFGRGLPLLGIREWYTRQIERAGLPFELNADEFLAIKVAVLVVATATAFLVHFLVYQSWAVVAGLIFIGLVFPDIRLSAAVRKHQHACLRALPGFLDLLALSVEAGMGFDSAVLNLTEVLEPGPLTRRFQGYLRGVNVGKTRVESLREVAAKLDLPDFTTFTNAVIQATDTGASLSPVLKTASVDMLHHRFERAEKKAHELPVKILLPLFVFIFPAIFLMILVPLYFQWQASGAGGAF